MKKIFKKTLLRALFLFEVALLLHLFLFILLFNNRTHDIEYCNLPGVEPYYEVSYNFLISPKREEEIIEEEKDTTPEFIAQVNPGEPQYVDYWSKNKKGSGTSKTLSENRSKKNGGNKKKGKGKNKKGGPKKKGSKGKGKSSGKFKKGGNKGRFKHGGKKWKKLIKNLDNSGKILAESLPDKFMNPLREEVSKSYVYRKRRHREIIVKEVFPTLKNIDKKFSDLIKNARKRLTKYNKRNEVIDDYQLWEKGYSLENTRKIRIIKQKNVGNKAPLTFNKFRRRNYFDSNVKLSKEQQLYNFLNEYGGYHPSKGDLPVALRELYYKNIQRIAYPFVEGDQTFFILDYYQENLNKEDFLINMLHQAKVKMGSKTMTETLFSLENIYDIQARGLGFYFLFQKRIFPFLTKERKKELRINTLRAVDLKYSKLLKEKKIFSKTDVLNKYFYRRFEVINFLIKNTPNGYRLKDALFQKGRIYWERGEQLGDRASYMRALKIWNSISLGKTNDIEFLYRDTLVLLKPLISKIKISNTNFNQAKYQVSQLMRVKERRDMHTKILREKKLLYP